MAITAPMLTIHCILFRPVFSLDCFFFPVFFFHSKIKIMCHFKVIKERYLSVVLYGYWC